VVVSTRGFGLMTLTGLIVVCLTVTIGCGKGKPQEKMAEKMIERAIKQSADADADIDLQEGRIRIKGEEGESEMSFGETKWPEDLPNDVPMFRMAKVRGVNRSEREGKKGWNVVLEEVKDRGFSTYLGELEKHGWTIVSDMITDEGGMLQASKDEWTLVGMYNKADAKGTIGVSMQ